MLEKEETKTSETADYLIVISPFVLLFQLCTKAAKLTLKIPIVDSAIHGEVARLEQLNLDARDF